MEPVDYSSFGRNATFNDMLMYFNNEYKNFYSILSKRIEFSSDKQGYLSIWLAIREISKQRYTAQFECRYAEFSDEIKELGLDEIAGNYVDKKPMPKKEFTLFVFYLISNEKFSDFIPDNNFISCMQIMEQKVKTAKENRDLCNLEKIVTSHK